jgi:Cdc6-like AAA superfamily ATPase
LSRRQQGTGQWFLDTFEFKHWLSTPNGTLFCPGIPGAGKTMVSAIAINHLSRQKSNASVGIACVFCNYKDQINQGTTNLLAAILKQLVQAQPTCAESMEHLYNQHVNRGTKPSLEEIYKALQAILSSYSTVYLVVDALDEYINKESTPNYFLTKVRGLRSNTDLRLLVTSRYIPEITSEFQGIPTLEIRANNEDIKWFVEGQIDQLPKCIQRDIELQHLVQDKIVEAVQGM